MKQDIHPKYNTEAKVKCACGNAFTTGSTKDEIYVEICSQCHPFYTGKQKLVDTARRVEKFQAKAKKTADIKATHKTSRPKKSATTAKTAPASLKEQLKKTRSAK